jgi:hypothetical protein
MEEYDERAQAALQEHERAVLEKAAVDDGPTEEVVPDRHESGGPYDPDSADATEEDADFEAEETNRKEDSA